MRFNKKHLFFVISLPIQVILVQFLSQKPEFIENYYSNGIYPILSTFLRTLLGWIPFAVGDVLGLILIVLLLKSTYELLKNKFKNSFSKVTKFIAFLAILHFCFYTFWGLNYFREPLAKNLNLSQSKYTTKELVSTTKFIITKLNALQLKITQNDTAKVNSPYQPKEIYKIAVNGYENLTKKYPQLSYTKPSIKNSLVSLLQSYNGTSGYINPWTNEAQVNDRVPLTSMPATTCHEMAHQIGWAAENEANFVGFLASIANDDAYFKYSGYKMAFSYLIQELKKRDKVLHKQLWNSVNKGIVKDFNANYKHWQQFKNPIEPYLKKGYNSYLKANKQAGGVASYNYVVDLLITYYSQ